MVGVYLRVGGAYGPQGCTHRRQYRKYDVAALRRCTLRKR
jgi:hypothetical protein